MADQLDAFRNFLNEESQVKTAPDGTEVLDFKVTDGDGTMIQNEDGSETHFRMTGHDTYESRGTRSDAMMETPLADTGARAAEANTAQIFDTNEPDVYGRRLATGFDEDGNLVSEEMLRAGVTFPTSFSSPEEEAAYKEFLFRDATGQANQTTEGLQPFAEEAKQLREMENRLPYDPQMAQVDAGSLERDRLSDQGIMGASWDRGVANLKVAGGGATSYIGEVLGLEGMRESGDQYAQDAAVDAALNPARVANIEEALQSPSAFATYAAEAVGENLPALIPDIVAAIAGAGFGAAATRGARQALVREAGKRYGAGLGAAMSMGTQSGGSFANEMTEAGIDDRGMTPLAVGSGVAAANLVPASIIFGRAAKASGVSDEVANKFISRAKDIVQTAAIGGATETIASPLSMLVEDMGRISADMMTIDDMNIDAYIEGTIRGALAGTGMGGTVSGVGNIAGAVTDAYTDARTVSAREQGATTDQKMFEMEAANVTASRGDYSQSNTDGVTFANFNEDGGFSYTAPEGTATTDTVTETDPLAASETDTSPENQAPYIADDVSTETTTEQTTPEALIQETEGVSNLPVRGQEPLQRAESQTQVNRAAKAKETETKPQSKLSDTRQEAVSTAIREDNGNIKKTSSVLKAVREGEITTTELTNYAESMGVEVDNVPNRRSNLDMSRPENEDAKNTFKARVMKWLNTDISKTKATKEAKAERTAKRDEVMAIMNDGTMSEGQRLNAVAQLDDFMVKRSDILKPKSVPGLVDAIRAVDFNVAETPVDTTTERTSGEIVEQSIENRRTMESNVAPEMEASKDNIFRGKLSALYNTAKPSEVAQLDSVISAVEQGIIDQGRFEALVDQLHNKLPAAKQFNSEAAQAEIDANQALIDEAGMVDVADIEADTDGQGDVDSDVKSSPDQLLTDNQEGLRAGITGMGYVTKQEQATQVTLELNQAFGTLTGLQSFGLRQQRDNNWIQAIGYPQGTFEVAINQSGNLNPNTSSINQIMTEEKHKTVADRIKRAIRNGGGRITPELISILRATPAPEGTVKAAGDGSMLFPDTRETSNTSKSVGKVRHRQGDAVKGSVKVSLPNMTDTMGNQVLGMSANISAPRMTSQYMQQVGVDSATVLTHEIYGHYIDAVENFRQTAAADGIPAVMNGLYNDSTVIYENPNNKRQKLTLGQAKLAFQSRRSSVDWGKSQATEMSDVSSSLGRLVDSFPKADGETNVDLTTSVGVKRGTADLAIDVHAEMAERDIRSMQEFDALVDELADGIDTTEFYTALDVEFSDSRDFNPKRGDEGFDHFGDHRLDQLPDPMTVKKQATVVSVSNKARRRILSANPLNQRVLTELDNRYQDLQQALANGTFTEITDASNAYADTSIKVGKISMDKQVGDAAIKAAKNPNTLNKVNKNMFTDVVNSAIGRLNKVSPALAKAMHDSSGRGYFRSVENRRRMFYSAFGNFLNNPTRLNKAMHDLNDGVATADTAELTKLLNRLNSYVERYNPMANTSNTPLVLRVEEMTARRAEVEAILREGGDLNAAKTFDQLIGSNGTTLEIDISPHALPGARRGVQSLNGNPLVMQALRDGGFTQQDGTTLMTQYIASAIRNAEWHRAMSTIDGGVFNENAKYRQMTELVKKGTPESQELNKIMQHMMGQVHQDIPKGWRNFNSVAIGFNNLRLLAFSALSTIPELGIVMSRAHDTKFAVKNLAHFTAKMMTTTGRADMNQFAKELGMLENIITKSAMTELYGSGELTVGATMNRATDLMFRVNGQHAITNMHRKYAAFMGKNFIYKHAENARNGDAKSKSYLKDLGITVEQAEAYRKYEGSHGQTGYDIHNKKVGDIVNPMADAVNMFSQQSVMTPNAAQLPLYASDPRFATVAHFKTFFYALHDTYYKGIVGGEFAKNRETKGIAKAAATMGPTVLFSMFVMVGLGALQDMMRNMIREGDPEMKGDETAKFMKAVSQSGLMGPGTIAESALNSASWGRNGVAAALGPTADFVANDILGNTKGREVFANSIPFVSQNVFGTKDYARQTYDKFLATDDYE